jgi:aminopeptidase N
MSRDISAFNSGYEYTFNTYCRGMLLFYNIAKMTGYEKFNSALAAFVQNNKFKFGIKEDLILCLEKTLNVSLGNYFNNYLAGLPK